MLRHYFLSTSHTPNIALPFDYYKQRRIGISVIAKDILNKLFILSSHICEIHSIIDLCAE